MSAESSYIICIKTVFLKTFNSFTILGKNPNPKLVLILLGIQSTNRFNESGRKPKIALTLSLALKAYSFHTLNEKILSRKDYILITFEYKHNTNMTENK